MRKKIRVAVIFGGKSGEHEVSLVSARSVMEALNPQKYKILPILISKTGAWKTKQDPFRVLQNCDVVFPVLHGPYGEDGTIQGFLELINIPYVGSGVFASAACMDKFMAKVIFKAYGLPQTKFLHFDRKQITKEFSKIKKNIDERIGYPCFVKPSNLGSSVGISKVKGASKLKTALALAASYDASVLVEEAINAREIECSVLGNETPMASLAGEIIPNREFYDYFAKYIDNASKLIIPANLTPKKMQEIQKLAFASYRALQCSGMARVDFLMDRKTQKFYVNEINTIPGFTKISMYPKLWEASGMSYPRLLDCLITLAFERYREKQKNCSSFESRTNWYKK